MSNIQLEDNAPRTCAYCGQPIPPKSMLAVKSKDGKDVCLACQIRDAQINKGLRH